MKNYILLFPDTFLWFNDRKGILYNCNEKFKFKFEFECNSLIYNYCVRLKDPSNLYSVEIQQEDMENKAFSDWVCNIVESKVGKIGENNLINGKPISLPPILNLRNEIEDLNSNETSYTDLINTDSCLNEITIYLGGRSLHGGRDQYYKQILYPIDYNFYIDYNILNSFLLTSNLSSVCKINIICTDIMNYPNLDSLINFLESYGVLINYYLEVKDVNLIKKFSKLILKSKSRINIYYYDIESFQNLNYYLSTNSFDFNWIFLIKNESDYSFAEEITTSNNLKNVDFWPIFTGYNESFFNENVFTSKLDIDNQLITKQNIFANEVVNSNFWGQLFILPNKDVFSNLNRPRLGTIDENIMEIVSRELVNPESSWKYVRSRIAPCKECLYMLLCPPPSNYEYYLNKFNLCSIHC